MTDGQTPRRPAIPLPERGIAAPAPVLSEDARAAGLDPARIPQHVAIIMDGNGRWARRRGLPREAGHREGREAIRRTLRAAVEATVPILSLFAFSTENWTRPREEVEALMDLLAEALRDETPELLASRVRFRASGDLDALSPALRSEMRRVEDETRAGDRLLLHVALNYGGRMDLARAARALAREAAAGRIDPEAIDEAAVASRLLTAGLPDPDLLIRTGGEVRVSNFLLWQIAYSELVFTAGYWPDFARHDLFAAIREYQARRRRYGGLDVGD